MERNPVPDRPADGGKAAIRESNRRRILDAAEAVFAASGYGGATMAQIAELADLPKANLHYYFGTKSQLYQALLDDILSVWLHDVDAFQADADPRAVVSGYVRSKLDFSRRRPLGSKVFAMEVIQGGPHLDVRQGGLAQKILSGVSDKYKVVEEWGRMGLIAPVDGRQFFIMIWALTQTYADFEKQVCILMGRSILDQGDWAHIFEQVEGFVFRALGLD